MDLEEKPSWSKGDLSRLGKALVIDKAAMPDGCPHYGEVMLWHNDLAAEVATRISNAPWVAVPQDQLSISARAKTVDTMVDKLQRDHRKLGDVQDLAGVRVDADMVLTQQTNLSQEIANHLGAAPKAIRDIRANPHSGYRAVHIWLVLPAGRVEVQIRTLYQSVWANTYEALGEFYGRGIRYGEEHEAAHVRDMVASMHRFSATFAEAEKKLDDEWQLKRLPRRLRRRVGYRGAASEKSAQAHADLVAALHELLETLHEVQNTANLAPGAWALIRDSTPAEEV
jgi:ppGpp synthetase/RelA/SpoT-type nucleotidyltranferase